MHTHSSCSDGSFSPEELIEIAKNEGIGAVALCDHNTVKGLERFENAAKGSGISAVSGVEITSEYLGCEVHILGLFLSREAQKSVTEYLDRINIRKEESNKSLAKRLKEGGYDIDYQTVREISGEAIPNRVHFAKALMAKGYVASVKEAFDGILKEGGDFYKPSKKADALEVVGLLHKAGALPAIAHPFLNLTKEELCTFLPLAKELGLAAMETIYPLYSQEESAEAERLAEKYGMLQSGGSDFHGANKPDIKMGRGKDNIEVGFEIYEKLKEAAQAIQHGKSAVK